MSEANAKRTEATKPDSKLTCKEHLDTSTANNRTADNRTTEHRTADTRKADTRTADMESLPPGGMTIEEYRERAKEMVDYIADYLQNIRQRPVFPSVKPGYMQELIPDQAPTYPDSWEDIFADIERAIMPGVTHWQSPYMHAYFPALNSYPSLLGDMLADAISCLGFTWASSPACTELETIVMDWLGKMLGLPSCFLHGNRASPSVGGGCIQTTASDCTFVTLLAARTEAIKRFKVTQPDLEDAEVNGRLIGYCSDQAHSSVEKAGLIGLVKMRFLHSDEELSLRGDTLQDAITLDRERGFIPFYVCATLGTTGACAFDNLKEIGIVCERERIWLHIDAAYAGSAFICPEYRTWISGIEYADSFAFNPSKWLMVHFDCSAMWVKDARALHRTFNVEPLYLQHENSGAAIDYMHWQIALSRRFRSLKLWFVLRCFGVDGLQRHIRRGVELAAIFEDLVQADPRFEVAARRHLGMVVFRIMGANDLTEDLLKRLNKQGRVHMVPASLKGKYVIRFTVTSQFTTAEDIHRDWKIITDMTQAILDEVVTREDSCEDEDEEEDEEGASEALLASKMADGDVGIKQRDVSGSPSKMATVVTNGDVLARKRPVVHSLSHPKGASLRRREFGISLLLSNVPMSPKVVNGSFAALFDGNNLDLDNLARQLIVGGEFIRLSPRKRGRLGFYDKQMSLDYSVLGDRRNNPHRMKMMGSLDSKIDDILEFGGNKGHVDSLGGQGEDGGNTGVDEEGEREGKANEDLNMDGDNKVRKVKSGINQGLGYNNTNVVDKENWDTGHAGPQAGTDQARNESAFKVESKMTRSRNIANVGAGVTSGNDEKEALYSNKDGRHESTSGAGDDDGTLNKETQKGGGGASESRSRHGTMNSRSVLEISKAVCSKVKDALMIFPGSPVPSPPLNVSTTTRRSTSYCSPPGAPAEIYVRGFCKHCGSALSGNGSTGERPAMETS